MSDKWYSIEQISDSLGLHVGTLRRYVREGRLKAVRIGKQYRVSADDLTALLGRPAPDTVLAETGRTRHVEVSSIVEIDAIGPAGAERLTNSLLGGAHGREPGAGNLRIETIYNAATARLKIVVVGSLETSAVVFRMIQMALEARP